MGRPSKTYSFTKRAKTFGNMWRVYSAKCDKSFVLSSDRELAHWILYLEYNPDVEVFDLNPSPRALTPDLNSKRTVLDAEVVFKNGTMEWHEIKMGDFDKETYSTPQVDRQRELAKRANVKYLIFNDSDFVPVKGKIMPLLKVAACLSAGRDYYVSPMLNLDVHRYLTERACGTLGGYLSNFEDQDKDLLLYLFCKKYIEGFLEVEFARSFFSTSTRWTIR